MPVEYDRVLLPIGKWAPDEPYLSESGNLDLSYGQIYFDGAWNRVHIPSVRGSVDLYFVPSAAILLSDSHEKGILAFKTRLYSYDLSGASPTITDRSKVGNYADKDWSLVRWGADVIATNGDDPVQIYDGTGPFADLITSTTKPEGKYLCVCRSRVILLNITAPDVNPRKFYWSALNDAENWEPASDGAGFGELPGSSGEITGAVGFEDFFLIFTTSGVFRATYIGGADIWSLQQVGGWHDGVPEGFDQAVVAIERDAYYLANTGPKAVRNGEAIDDIALGQTRRWLTQAASPRRGTIVGGPSDASMPLGSGVTESVPFTSGQPRRPWAAFDAFRHIIYWAWDTHNVEGIESQRLHLYAYSPGDRAFSYLTPFELAVTNSGGGFSTFARLGPIFARPGYEPAATVSTDHPDPSSDLGEGVAFLAAFLNTAPGPGGASNDWFRIYHFDRTKGYLVGTMVTKTWRPGAGVTTVRAVRLLWKPQYDTKRTPPEVRIQVDPENNGPTVSTAGNATDDRGFLVLESPYQANEMAFAIRFTDVGGTPSQIRDVLGLELLVTVEKSKHGSAAA